jgi:transmembrane sensor
VAASIALLLGNIMDCMGSFRKIKILQHNQTVIVPAGQRVQLVLADGTKVWLNSKTTFTYPAALSADKNREVTLNGEAYFEVKKDAEHPFLVKTNTYDIQVFGTTFNVYAYDNADYFETSLINGSVLEGRINIK